LVVKIGVKSVPTVFIVSDEITIEAYKRFWQSLYAITKGRWNPEAFITDFEQAIISSLQQQFPKTPVWGSNSSSKTIWRMVDVRN